METPSKEHHVRLHVSVDVDGVEKHLTFEHGEVTGGELRELSGAPIGDNLYRVESGEPIGPNIGPDERVALTDGEHFAAIPREIPIVVEVDGQDKHVKFEDHLVTGRQIRERAGAPLTYDLTKLDHSKPVGGNIGLDQTVRIHPQEHFLALPAGKVS
jgi:hypothetical protein